MTNSRENKPKRLSFNFFKLEKNSDPPPNYPLRAKPLSSIVFPYKSYEDEQRRKSYHSVNKAYKVKDLHKKNKSLYFVKQNEPDSPMTELEGYYSYIAQFLAPNNAPSAHPYFNDLQDSKFVAVASKAIPNFQSNHDRPLKNSDIVVKLIDEVFEQDIKQSCELLDKAIQDLLQILERPSTSSFQYAKNMYNYYIASAPTAIKLKESLSLFNNSSTNKYLTESLNTLLVAIRAREKHIVDELAASSQYHAELDELRKVMQIINEMLDGISPGLVKTLHQFEIMSRVIERKKINLDSLSNDKPLTEKIYNEEFTVTVLDLRNYRNLRSLADGLCTRRIINDPDGHSQNLSFDARIIDFDWAKANIRFRVIKNGLWDTILRKPDDQTFIVTANDIARFPDMHDANFYYWVTKQTEPVSKLPKKYIIPQNLFTEADNLVFKKLAHNHVFNFHKYKMFLKYILTDPDMYRGMAKVCVRTDLMFVDELDGKQYNLVEECIRDEEANIAQYRNVLTQMPSFKKFLEHHGEFAFRLIMNDFKEFKAKISNKALTKPAYEPLRDSIKFYALEQRFKRICLETGIDLQAKKPTVSNAPTTSSVQCKS